MARPRLSQDVFIDRLKYIYGNKLDFSGVVYKNRRDVVCVTCRKHGSFIKTAGALLSGSGCPQCGHDDRGQKAKRSGKRASLALRVKQDFMEVLSEQGRVALSPYENCRTQVTILCKGGHVVKQSPYSIVSHGRGCPMCKKHWVGHGHLVYVMQCMQTGLVKIGKTKCLKQRLHQLRKHQKNLDVIATFRFGNGDNNSALTAEKHAHEYFRSYNACLTGFPGSTELFKITTQDAIDYLKGEGGMSMVMDE